jgi:hypothetical protein
MRSASSRVRCAALALVLTAAFAPPSHAKGDPLSAVIVGGGFLLYAATVALVGAVALAAKGVSTMSSDRGHGARAEPPPRSTAPAAPADALDAAAAARREYLARPACHTVGGYEAHLKTTGELCRLD